MINLDGMDRNVKIVFACIAIVVFLAVMWIVASEQDDVGNIPSERGLGASLLLMGCFALLVMTGLLALAYKWSRGGYSPIREADARGVDVPGSAGHSRKGTEFEQHRAERQRAELLSRTDGGEGNIFITNQDL